MISMVGNIGQLSDKELTKAIGELLRRCRKDARMTQGDLAEKLHVTKSYISRIENGLISPSVSMFNRIVEALGMRVEIVKPLG